MAVIPVSCFNDDDDKGGSTLPPAADLFYDFATYNGSANNASSFSVQREGDSPEAVITFNRTFTDKQLKPGNRVFMAYTTMSGQRYVSGTGNLYAVSDATGGKPVAATDENRVNLSTPVKMTEMKRTGGYLNVVFQVPALQNLLKLQLTVKENEKDPAYPVMGLFVRTDDEFAGYQYARVSFDVKDVLAPADVKGLKVAYFGDNGLDTLTFVKGSGTGTITPAE